MAKKTAKKSTRKNPGPAARRRKAPGMSTAHAVGDAGPMSLPLLEQLVKLMSANDLTNVELQDGQQRIVLNRGGHPVAAAASPPPPPAPAAASPAAPPVAAPAPAGGAGESARAEGLVEIRSPMVGTFYTSPSPDAKAFVQVGDRVTADTDVCIIEAMKVFNNIKAETAGTIEKILVENGSAVEYGQPLFLVKPA